MRTATFRFIGALNDFLPPGRREADFTLAFQAGQSLKHLVESCSAPHVEVAAVFANGAPAALSYLVQDGDRIEVHPYDLPMPAGGPLRFVLDNHLGKLAATLRLLGFDVNYRNDLQDPELAQISSQEQRILLTRDRRLLMRTLVTRGYWVRSQQPRRQLDEIMQRYGLYDKMAPLQRCAHCNTPLQPVDKAQILEQLQPLTRQYFDMFQRCPGCGQVYWAGSHLAHIQALVKELRSEEGQP